MGDDWKFSVEDTDAKIADLKLEKKVANRPVKLKLDFENKPKIKSRSEYANESKEPDENVLVSNIKYYGKKIIIVLILASVGFGLAKYFNLL